MRGTLIHKGNKYYLKISLGWNHDTNQYDQKWHPLEATDQATAEKEVEKLRAKLTLGQEIHTEKITLTEYLNRWLSDCEKRLAPSTVKKYDRDCRLYIKPELGKYVVCKITPRQIRILIDKLYKDKGAFVAGHVYRVLHTAFQKAVWDGDVGLTENIIDRIEPPDKPEVKHEVWDPAQINKFLEYIKDSPRYPVFLCLFTTGARVGEVLGMSWADVDTKKKTWRISRKVDMNIKFSKESFGKPKTKKSVRTILLTDNLVNEIKRIRKEQQLEKWKAKDLYEKHTCIFAQPNGRPIWYSTIREEFQSVAKKLKLPIIRVHDIRHSVATYLLSLGASLAEVQDILGHSTPVITKTLYDHGDINRQKPIMDKINELIK
jgi:integrase